MEHQNSFHDFKMVNNVVEERNSENNGLKDIFNDPENLNSSGILLQTSRNFNNKLGFIYSESM